MSTKPKYDALYFKNESALANARYHLSEAVKALENVEHPNRESAIQGQRDIQTVKAQLEGVKSLQAKLAPFPKGIEMLERNEAMQKLLAKGDERVY